MQHSQHSCNSFPVSILDKLAHIFSQFLLIKKTEKKRKTHLKNLIMVRQKDLSVITVPLLSLSCILAHPFLFIVYICLFHFWSTKNKFTKLQLGMSLEIKGKLCFFLRLHLTSISIEICFNGQAGCKTSVSCCLTFHPGTYWDKKQRWHVSCPFCWHVCAGKLKGTILPILGPKGWIVQYSYSLFFFFLEHCLYITINASAPITLVPLQAANCTIS